MKEKGDGRRKEVMEGGKKEVMEKIINITRKEMREGTRGRRNGREDSWEKDEGCGRF